MIRDCLAVALAILVLSGCGGPPRAARVAVAQTAGGLLIADSIVAEAVRSRGESSRAQVLSEVQRGELSSAADALDRWEALMQPTSAARDGLRSARAALRAVEAAVDAWEAGTGSERGFSAAAGCAVGAISHAIEAMREAGLEVPSVVLSGLALVQGFAGACHAP